MTARAVDHLRSLFRRLTDYALQQSRRFSADRVGNVMIAFAIGAPTLMLAAASSIEYSRAVALRDLIQHGADAAAVAGTRAMVEGKSVDEAKAISLAVFRANVPNSSLAQATTSTTRPGDTVLIETSNYSATETTLVRYQGAMPLLFAGVLNVATMDLNVTAEAQAVTSATSGAQAYAGVGTMWGDPYIQGADGVFHDMMCTDAPPDSWYNALSDRKIQINIECSGAAVFGGQWQVISAYSILVDDHVITFAAPQPVLKNGVWDWGDIWYGQVIIDGRKYPATIGHHSYLNGLVQTDITDLYSLYLGDNWVTVTTPNYVIKAGFSYQTIASGQFWVTAKGAGACGVPGGILGGLLAGVYHSLTNDYLVSGPSAKSAEFSWGQCATAGGTKTVRLVQ